MSVISPSIPELIAKRLLAIDTSDAMATAVENNKFYVEATQCIGGTYSIGAMDDDLPCLHATKDEAEADRKEMEEEWAQQIAAGERDEGDEWNAEVWGAQFNPDDNTKIDLLDDNGEVFHTESIDSLCGF